MTCVRNADFYIAVYSAYDNVMHKQSVNIFHRIFVKGLFICNAFLHISECLCVVYNLVYFTEHFPAHRQPVLNNSLCLYKGQSVALYCG